MELDLTTLLGWIGMGMLLAAYGGRDRLPPRTYAVLNLVGATLVGIDCYDNRTWPAFALETAWAAIAVHQLLRLRRPRRTDPQP